MNQNQIGRTVFDIDEETDAFYLQKVVEYHEWLLQQEAQPRLTRTLIFRDREDAERRLRADYFDDHLSWQGQYGRGDKKYPTIMLEAVASQDLWIWHAFYGMAGANNDINVLDNSSLFDDLLDDLAHVVPYVVNGVEYRNGYYLADGIYPEWASFVKSFTVATDPKHTYFKQRQESAQKDVERAFGVLQGRWGLIQQPARAYEVNTLRRIIYVDIIMHNMILEDQNMSVVDFKHVYSNPASCTDSPVLASLLDSGYSLCFYFIMGSITSLKCVLAQVHLNAICAKYFVPEEGHLQLPSPDATMHERPTGKNLDSVKNWNDHFFWVDEFVVPANARFSWFSGSNITKDRAPAPSEYNVEHVNTLIAQASPFLRFPEEFLCWVGISRNYLLNKDTYPRFVYEDGEEMDLNAFIRTADPRKVRVVERARAENERPIVTMAKHRTVTLLPTTVARSSGELSASVEREFAGDAGTGDGGDQGFDSVAGGDNVEPTVPVTEPVEAEIPRPKRSKKKRVIYDSEGLPVAPHPPKRLRADYGNTGGSATGGKSLSALNRLLQDSRLTVEQGVPALPTLPFITSSVTASPLEEGGDRTDSVTRPSLRTIGPFARFVVLSDSSHHSGAKSADPGVDSLARSDALVMTEATTVTIPTDINKDKIAPHPSVFGSSSSSEKTDRTLSLFAERSGSGFDAGSIRAEEAIGAGSEGIYIPEWTVTKGFGMNNGRLCANMIDHFTPPAFFKTVRGIEHEQLFTEFNRSLAEEKNILLEAKDKEIEVLKSQLLKAKEESAEVAQLRAQVSSLEAAESSLRGEVASTHDHNVLLEQECNSLKLKVTGLESIIAEKDKELSDLGASSSSLQSQNQSLVNQVHELEVSSADLREKLETYEESLKHLEEFQDNLMEPLRTRLAEIDADFTRCCIRFQESFHPHLLNVIAGRRWLLTHGMKLLVVKCLNSNEYMEALGHAGGPSRRD
ncbi:gypsy type transposase [Tanacetum coccineum]